MDKVNVFVAAIIAGVLAFWVPLWMGRSDSGNFDRIPQIHVDMVASVAEWSPKRFQGYLESYVGYLVDRGRIVQANRFLHEHSKVILAGRGRGSKLNHPARWMDVESLNLLTARGGVTWTSRDLAEAMKHGNLYFLEHRVGTVLQDYSPKDAGRLMLDFAEIAYRDRLTNICDRRECFSRVMQDFVYVISVNEMKYLHYYSSKYGKDFTAPVLLWPKRARGAATITSTTISRKRTSSASRRSWGEEHVPVLLRSRFPATLVRSRERMQLSKLETKAAREAAQAQGPGRGPVVEVPRGDGVVFEQQQ
ncbi:MAG: hypothetical protein R3D85_16805 [Paracoccaceae bacterium]